MLNPDRIGPCSTMQFSTCGLAWQPRSSELDASKTVYVKNDLQVLVPNHFKKRLKSRNSFKLFLIFPFSLDSGAGVIRVHDVRHAQGSLETKVPHRVLGGHRPIGPVLL